MIKLMSLWIQIGSELNNDFYFKLSNDINDKLKIKFIKSYFESSHKILNYMIFVTIFFSIIKQNSTEGQEYVLSYKIIDNINETEIENDQFNPINNV